jgi:hypothetical protein
MDGVLIMPRWQVQLIEGWILIPQLLAVAVGTIGGSWTRADIHRRLVAACVAVASLIAPAKLLFSLADYFSSPAANWLFLLVLIPGIGAVTGYLVSRWVVNALRRRSASATVGS